MATTYSPNATGVLDGTLPVQRAKGDRVNAKVHVVSSGLITMAAQAAGDTIVLGKLPRGAVPLYGVINASATMGASATVAIGITGTTGKYRAAAVFTAAAPTLFGVHGAMGDALAADETLLATIAVAALPSGGTFSVDMYYSVAP